MDSAKTLALCVACLLWAGLACAGGKRGGDPPKLRLEVEARPATILLGDDARLHVRLVNAGERRVTVYWPRWAYVEAFRFRVSRKGGAPLPAPTGPTAPTPLASNFKAIAPGKHLESWVILGEAQVRAELGQTARFPAPGEYVVNATFASLFEAVAEAAPGRRTRVPGAWVGTVRAKPLALVVRAPEPRAKRGQYHIDGRVVDQAGAPVARARVLVRSSHEGELDVFPKMVALETWFTDAKGRFAFTHLPDASPFFELEAIHPRYTRKLVRLVVAPERKRYDATVVMADGLLGRGVVRDTRGRPMPGVLVRFLHDLDKAAFTDGHGRFELRGLTPTPRFGFFFGKEGREDVHRIVSPKVAASGDWAVTFGGADTTSLRGRALLGDGKPVANMMLLFQLQGRRGRRGAAAAHTDAQGRFQTSLPDDDTYQGTVLAVLSIFLPGIDSDKRAPEWRTTVAGLANGQNDVRIVFGANGAIEVSVEPDGPLPPQERFFVTCSTQFEDVGPQGGRVLFKGLSPGTYQINVSTSLARWGWVRRVVLGEAAASRKATVRMLLPRLELGALRARLLWAKDRRPFDGSVELVTRGGPGGRSIGLGREVTRDGRVEIKNVLAGRVWVGAELRGRRLGDGAFGVVRAGQTTDLGEILVPSQGQRPRQVAGRVAYEDGSPAVGAAVGDESSARAVSADGSFRAEVEAGSEELRVALGGATGWPRARPGALAPVHDPRGRFLPGEMIRTWRDTLYARIARDAREPIRRDVVLSRKGLRDVRVRCPMPRQKLRFVLVVVDGEGQQLVRQGEPDARGDAFSIPDVPAGRTVVVLSRGDYYGYAEVEAGDEHPALTFDPAAAGRVAGRVTRADGRPAAGVDVELRPAPRDWSFPAYDTLINCPEFTRPRTHTTKTASDGSFRLASVGPGRYIIRTAQHGPANDRALNVVAGKETAVQLVTSALREPAPPLREPAARRPARGGPPASDGSRLGPASGPPARDAAAPPTLTVR